MDRDGWSSQLGMVERSGSRGVYRRQQTLTAKSTIVLSLLAAVVPTAMAQGCISLAGSTTCPAFRNASISTNKGLAGLFPFLAFVSDTESFDNGLRQYIATDYARSKYQEQLGCSSLNLTNTTALYARYTASFLCNAIVQNSIQACGLSANNSRPLCAESCAQFATSEQRITATPDLCGTSNPNAITKIRADFTDCYLPPPSLTQSCVFAYENEPDNCGYGSNLQGLCAFCGASSPNATDSCCVNSKVESRCEGVKLPTTTSMPPLFPSSTSSAAPTATSTTAGASKSSGLSGGKIAGIVVGSVLGAALLAAAVLLCCWFMRRKRQTSRYGSALNTPSPTRQNMPRPPMSQDGNAPATILPGARVARMSALEGSTSSGHHSSRAGRALGAYHSDDAYESPDSARSGLGSLPKRDGSLSSHSVLGGTRHSSPHSGSDNDRNFSSPEGVASGQSEQLQFFKDYYSQDDIHPNDTVAVLWAYQPRANDEFELERGDMLKVVGIWDDGWATGVRLSEQVDQWEARRQLQRDSGVSNGSRLSTALGESEIKAFPLVCVCLPQHWRKTIEGDTTDTAGGSGGDRPPPSP